MVWGERRKVLSGAHPNGSGGILGTGNSQLATAAVARLFRTGQPPHSAAELTASTRMLAAIQRSLRPGGKLTPVPR